MNWNPNETSPGKYFIVALVVCATIASPFWFLFQFHLNIFDKYDLSTLIFLSFCIGFPIWALHAYNLISMADMPQTRNKERISIELRLQFFNSSVYTIFLWYCPLAATFFRPKIPSEEMMYIYGILHVSFIIISRIADYFEKRKKKKPKNQDPPTDN